MKFLDDKSIVHFREGKLKDSETILGHIDAYVGRIGGTGEEAQRNGKFIVTDERACFFAKSFFREIFETIPLSMITSVEASSRLGVSTLAMHTSHDDLTVRTIRQKKAFDAIYEIIEENRYNSREAATAENGTGIHSSLVSEEHFLAKLEKLANMKEKGLLSEDEFSEFKLRLINSQ